MDVYVKLNELIKSKNITKRQFSNLLRDLEPKLKSTGETPSEKTIYKYLSGDINIPIELIPYIAETLDILEQELFGLAPSSKRKLIKFVSQNLDATQLDHAKLEKNKVSLHGYENFQETEKVVSLLKFAPSSLIKRIILKLEEIKKISLSDI